MVFERGLSKFNLILILFVIVCVSYINSLGNDFIWDDDGHILRNNYLVSFKFLPSVFSSTIFNNIGVKSYYYRPIQTVSYMIDYHVWKLNPFGYHLTNLFLHFLNVTLIFILVYELSFNKLISFLSSAIFAVHPAHASLVSYISGRADLLVTLFILSSLVLFKKFHEFKKTYFLIYSLFFFVLALLTKEIALVLPFLIILLDYFVIKYTKKDNYHFLQRIRYYLLFFILFTIYLITKTLLTSDINILFNKQQSIFGLSHFFGIFSEYIKLLTIPVNLCSDRSWSDINKFQFAGFFGFILLVLISVRYSKLAIFGLVWFIICYIPISNIFISLNAPLAENWLYLPSIGFFVMLVIFTLCIPNFFHGKLTKQIFTFCISFIIVAYCILTIGETFGWKNNRVFFERLVRRSPNSLRAHYNLGIAYEHEKLFDRAIEEEMKAIALDPNNLDVYLVLGDLYFVDKRDFVKAEEIYNKIIEINPKFYCGYMRLVELYKETGQEDKARFILSKVKHLVN